MKSVLFLSFYLLTSTSENLSNVFVLECLANGQETLSVEILESNCQNVEENSDCRQIQHASGCIMTFEEPNCQGRSSQKTPVFECGEHGCKLNTIDVQFAVRSFRSCEFEQSFEMEIYKYRFYQGLLAQYKNVPVCENKPITVVERIQSVKISGYNCCVQFYQSYNCVGLSVNVRTEKFATVLVDSVGLKLHFDFSDFKSFGLCSKVKRVVSWKVNLIKIMYHIVESSETSTNYEILDKSMYHNNQTELLHNVYKFEKCFAENTTINFNASKLDFSTISWNEDVEHGANLNKGFTKLVNWDSIKPEEKTSFHESILSSIKNGIRSYNANLPNFTKHMQQQKKLQFYNAVYLPTNIRLEIRSGINLVKNLHIRFDLLLGISGKIGDIDLTASVLRTTFGSKLGETEIYNETTITAKLDGKLNASLILQSFIEKSESAMDNLNAAKNCPKNIDSEAVTGIYIGPFGLLFLGMLLVLYVAYRVYQNRTTQNPTREEDPFEGTIYYFNPDQYRVPKWTPATCNQQPNQFWPGN